MENRKDLQVQPLESVNDGYWYIVNRCIIILQIRSADLYDLNWGALKAAAIRNQPNQMGEGQSHGQSVWTFANSEGMKCHLLM